MAPTCAHTGTPDMRFTLTITLQIGCDPETPVLSLDVPASDPLSVLAIAEEAIARVVQIVRVPSSACIREYLGPALLCSKTVCPV